MGLLIDIFGMAINSYFSVREGKKSTNDALPVPQFLNFPILE
jgi:solute carrier family 35 protein E3